MTACKAIRQTMRQQHRAPEADVIRDMAHGWAPSAQQRRNACARATGYARHLRQETKPSPMEAFLGEYGLSTDEGVALMCLAEALLRVPDTDTIDALIDDKISPHAWGAHLGKASSPLVNASTWALMLTGRVLDDDVSKGLAGVLHSAVKRLGEPVIRLAVEQAMKELGRQFVLGRTIEEAQRNAASSEARGYTYSYDMLGEAAMTAQDASSYDRAYHDAIAALAKQAKGQDVRDNPGISIKLSALNPRYDRLQHKRVMDELVPRVAQLARAASKAGIGFNIDAEEADRLDLSLDVIERVLRDPALAGWNGFGVVVQAYGKRAMAVIEWLDALAASLDRSIMVRLVKGAYWDTEIKRAQVDGVSDYPVFSEKRLTDISFLCCAKRLLVSPRMYPQFATHNAHSIASILEMAETRQAFEFQRLHGMGDDLHDVVLKREGTRCRIYAPVGAHRDLLAYLVRRLLENGANSSFVNQITDRDVPIEEVVADPFSASKRIKPMVRPGMLFAPARQNALGWDLRDPAEALQLDDARAPYLGHVWRAEPLMAGQPMGADDASLLNPANPDDIVGSSLDVSAQDVRNAIDCARAWQADAATRAQTLRAASDLFERAHGELFALLTREAGKTMPDAIAELREAVDFLRYYACEAERLANEAPRGIFACISPWNFPLAIFTGQVAAALAAGNAVLAKPAEATPLIAWRASQLLHDAGVPRTALQVLPGKGAEVGAQLVSDPRVSGVCFTGSTQTAQSINRAMAANIDPAAPLIAETGGLNAMIVDSTALPEQAVRDVIASAFQSAGQRCSALRILYVQEDVVETVLTMIKGAMDELRLGAPWDLATDIGPVITQDAQQSIQSYVDAAVQEGRLIKQMDAPTSGTFVGPALVRVSGIEDLPQEVFGPVLHIATFKVDAIDDVIAAINERGYGLTFGLHSRIDDRAEQIVSQMKVGNIYINRNQIGAVVGSQPFGGESLSGTGPKAGGPHYVQRFCQPTQGSSAGTALNPVDQVRAQAAINAAPVPLVDALTAQTMPGPTGESNRLSTYARGTILCLGPSQEDVAAQAQQVRATGCAAVELPGSVTPTAIAKLEGFDGVIFWGNPKDARALRKALAGRAGPLLAFITEREVQARCLLERHVCIDTTAAGGNASLMSDAA